MTSEKFIMERTSLLGRASNTHLNWASDLVEEKPTLKQKHNMTCGVTPYISKHVHYSLNNNSTACMQSTH